MSKAQTWVFLPDIHFPRYDKLSWKAALDFIRRNKIDGV